MRKAIRTTAIILLFINGISGLAGSYSLIADPSGKDVRMPIELLAGSPFSNFLIPGLVLLVFIGVSSLIVAYFTIGQYKHYPLLLIYQGITVWIWLSVQIAVIKTLDPLQLVYGLIGLGLVLCGLMTRKKQPVYISNPLL
jgi:hypothetical protein